MIDYTQSEAHRAHMKRMEAKMFAPGAFVMLHHESRTPDGLHPDAGRIGQIVKCDGNQMIVEFFRDELVGSGTFCLIPRNHWAPVPETCVEEYEPRAKRRGWRVSERGKKIFDGMGWQTTAATFGAPSTTKESKHG